MENVPQGKLLLDTTGEPDTRDSEFYDGPSHELLEKKKCMKCGFTLVLCFARRWCVKPFMERFMQMPIDDHCHLVIFDNTDKVLLRNELLPWAEKLAKVFYTVRYYKSYRPFGGTFKWEKDQGIEKSKIPKIYQMHLDVLKLLTTKKFVMLEDDTIPPKDCVMELLSRLDIDKKIAFVSGIATGRDPNPLSRVRLGAHYVEREGNRILRRFSPSPNLKGIYNMDACGTYCLATYTDLWKWTNEQIQGFFYDLPRFALDGFQTNNLKQKGYKILVDFDMWCDHLQACGGKIISFGKKNAVPMLDVWLPDLETYAQGIVLQDKELAKINEKYKMKPY